MFWGEMAMIANVLESHAVTSTLPHHVVLSGKGILLRVVQVLQCVLQTPLFRYFIPCVIRVSPRKSFITNSICSENCFPFKPKPVGWETTSKRSGISIGSGNSVLAGCLAGQQVCFFICLTEGFDHGDKQLKNACKERYLLKEGQWLRISRALFILFGCFCSIKE